MRENVGCVCSSRKRFCGFSRNLKRQKHIAGFGALDRFLSEQLHAVLRLPSIHLSSCLQFRVFHGQITQLEAGGGADFSWGELRSIACRRI